MKLALAVWNGRISPVFDVSREIEVLDVENGQVVSRQMHDIETDNPFAKAARLADLGVETLVCGAVSRPLAAVVASQGIRMIPFVAGETEEVLAAFLAGNLPAPGLTMPGCGGRRARFHGGQCGRKGRWGHGGW